MKCIMTPDKETKNTVRFAEVLANKDDAPQVGIVYMPKGTLNGMGWKDGENLTFEVRVAKAKAKAGKEQ